MTDARCTVCNAPALNGCVVCFEHASRCTIEDAVVALQRENAALRHALEAAGDRGTLLALDAALQARRAERERDELRVALAETQRHLAELQGRVIRARGPS